MGHWQENLNRKTSIGKIQDIGDSSKIIHTKCSTSIFKLTADKHQSGVSSKPSKSLFWSGLKPVYPKKHAFQKFQTKLLLQGRCSVAASAQTSIA